MLKVKRSKCSVLLFDNVLVRHSGCPCVAKRVCVDIKQVPSVYHSSIHSENKSQIWEESFHHLRGREREKVRGRGEEEKRRKEKKKESRGETSVWKGMDRKWWTSKSSLNSSIASIRPYSVVPSTGKLDLLCLCARLCMHLYVCLNSR